jgi:hypothetical protein
VTGRARPASALFPLYDGNGMFYSAGNIVGSGKVGMLFMDLGRPFAPDSA